MKKLTIPALAALSVLFGGCGGGGGDADEFVKLDTSKAEAFAAGGDDCDEKAKSVRAWRIENNKRYKELRESLGKKYKDGPPESMKEALNKNKKAVMKAMLDCSSNEAFGKAIDET